jgi:predicted ferric reductase
MVKPMVARKAKWIGSLYLLIYLAAVLTPLLLATALRPQSPEGFFFNAGRGCALVGIAILLLNPILGARLKWVDRPFGLDMVFRFHKAVAWIAVVLLVVHPLLLSWDEGIWTLLTDPDEPWNIWVGRAALLLVVANAITSGFRPRIRFDFQVWRWTHNVLVTSLLSLAFVHSYATGSDLQPPIMRFVWPTIFTAIAAVYIYHRVLWPLQVRGHRWTVVGVKRETHNVHTVTLESPRGDQHYDYLPGQFQFMRLYRPRGLSREEHHFTVSSSPTREGIIASTIKEVGDFTSTIGQTRPGDTAEVRGAYGRFSYVLYPEERDLVFVAGGIGITPFMSMIRHMRDSLDERSVLLLYGNRHEQDIVFRDEIDGSTRLQFPRLTVVYALTDAQPDWTGEHGRINRRLILKYCGPQSLAAKAFYVCAPARMSTDTVGVLRDLGVGSRRIHCERFWL